MRAVLDQGKPFQVEVETQRIIGWSWGSGPAVYLVHGWGSRGGRLSAYVQPLVDAGVRVITFDAIGHGASGGRMSSMPQWPGSRLVTTHGLGHSEIVRTPDIVAQGVEFLVNHADSAAASARTPSATRSASPIIVK